MSHESGAANMRNFNAKREDEYLTLIQAELALCQRRHLQFRSISMLAAHLSDRTRIHRTTFGRNAKYKALLALHLSAQSGASSIVGDDTDDPFVLRAKLASGQLEIGRLRKEVTRLTAQLSRPLKATGSPSTSDPDYVNLCVLTSILLARAGTFGVDRGTRTVVDLAARPSERVVAGPERASAFVAWLEQNSSLPFVQGIRSV